MSIESLWDCGKCGFNSQSVKFDYLFPLSVQPCFLRENFSFACNLNARFTAKVIYNMKEIDEFDKKIAQTCFDVAFFVSFIRVIASIDRRRSIFPAMQKRRLVLFARPYGI